MFMALFDDPMDYWIEQSNLKLRELNEVWNASHEKPRPLFQISKNDARAFICAVLHMGLSNKNRLSKYWSRNELRNDQFILKLYSFTGLSARRFRRIVNCIRLYCKEEAVAKGFDDKSGELYDEHHKVVLQLTHFL